MNNFDLIKKIISKNANINYKDLDIKTSSENQIRWDSLAHIRIILDIEKEFKIKINTSQASELNSIKKILDYLE